MSGSLRPPLIGSIPGFPVPSFKFVQYVFDVGRLKPSINLFAYHYDRGESVIQVRPVCF